jgi:hypothetical protein
MHRVHVRKQFGADRQDLFVIAGAGEPCDPPLSEFHIVPGRQSDEQDPLRSVLNLPSS